MPATMQGAPPGLIPLIQKDFSGGVNAVTNPYDVGEKQCQRIRNMLLDEHGSLRTRDGYAVVTTSPVTVSSPILYRGVLSTTGGSVFPFAIQQVGSEHRLYRTDTTPWTLVTSYASTEPIPQSVTMVDTEIIARGYLTPLQYNGTTAVPITATAGQTVPPGAKHIAFHLGSLWVWNTSAATTTLDGSSSIRMSDPNNPNSWPNANQTFIGKDDGQVGMGLATFTIAETGISPTQTLVAFKNYSTYQVTGVFGSASFSVQKVKTDMGCTAPRSIQFVSGFGIIRMTHKGFALFNGVDDRLISEEVRPFIFGRDEIQGLNTSAISQSWAVQSQNPPLYVAACPVSGSGLSRLFVYDLVRRTWTICDFPIDFSCLSLFTVTGSTPTVHAGTFSTGQIVSLFDGAQTDNGTPISWSFRTRPFIFGAPTRYGFWRRLLLDVLFTPVQTITVLATFLGPTTTATKVLTLGGASPSSLWGTGIWGTMIWGATGELDGRGVMDLIRSAYAVTFDISGAGNVRIRTVEAQGRPKPLTGVVTF